MKTDLVFSNSQLQKMVYQYYRYDPIVAPAIVALVLFSITTALHAYQLAKTRAWYMIPMLVGGISAVPCH